MRSTARPTGLVQHTGACKVVCNCDCDHDFERDLPTCTGTRLHATAPV